MSLYQWMCLRLPRQLPVLVRRSSALRAQQKRRRECPTDLSIDNNVEMTHTEIVR